MRSGAGGVAVSKRRTRLVSHLKVSRANPQRETISSKPEKKPFWRQPLVWLGGVATVVVAGVLINVLTPPAQRLTSSSEPTVTVAPLTVVPQATSESKRRSRRPKRRPAEAGPPLSVVSEDPLNLDDLGVWFFPGKLLLSASELAHANALLHDTFITGFADYLYSFGGYAQNTDTQIVLQNDSKQPVKILDMRVVKDCQAPLTGTLVFGPNAGGDDDVRIGFDLDSPDTDAESAKGWFVNDWKKDYFSNYNISFAPGEQRVLNVRAVTGKYACTFRYMATVLEGKRKFYQTIDDDGQPFRVSAFVTKSGDASNIDFSKYAAVYIGGVDSPHKNGNYVRVSPRTYHE